LLLGAFIVESLRVEGRVMGEGGSISLSRGAAGTARAPFPSSHGSFLPAVRGTHFFTGAVDAVFTLVFACRSDLAEGAPALVAIASDWNGRDGRRYGVNGCCTLEGSPPMPNQSHPVGKQRPRLMIVRRDPRRPIQLIRFWASCEVRARPASGRATWIAIRMRRSWS
jgi:hypothetical protein